jgi:hypothetical protein
MPAPEPRLEREGHAHASGVDAIVLAPNVLSVSHWSRLVGGLLYAASPRIDAHTAPTAAEQLSRGLTGMGFRAPEVRAFVTSLGDRVATEPLPALIREGLAALGSRAGRALPGRPATVVA